MSYNAEHMIAEKKEGLNWLTGGIMIGVAALFDLITLILALFNFIPLVGTVVVLAVAWIPNLFALLTFSFLLAIKGEANFKKIAILVAPLVAGSTGIPGWTATIWPLVAKIIAAKTLSKVSPGASRVLNKI